MRGPPHPAPKVKERPKGTLTLTDATKPNTLAPVTISNMTDTELLLYVEFNVTLQNDFFVRELANRLEAQINVGRLACEL